MDLWIRSQDRTQLLKVIGLYYDYQQEKHHITCITENDYYWVGIYETRERALEVLDEIQDFIENGDTTKITQDIHGITSEVEFAKRVYNMPKE